jgi:hypothetical protein
LGGSISLTPRNYSPILSLTGGTTPPEYWINLNPIHDKSLKKIFYVTGNTNLPVGSRLYYESYRSYFCPGGGCPFIGPNGTVSVIFGLNKTNVFSIALDGSAFPPNDEFIISITSPDKEISGVNLFRTTSSKLYTPEF